MRTFFSEDPEWVDASSHTAGAEYRVGIGTEMWESTPVRVLKVQMAYDRRVAGRKAPSFPIIKENIGNYSYNTCPDFDEIVRVAEQLVAPLRTWIITWDRPFNGPDVSNMVSEALKEAFALHDADIESPCHGVRTAKLETSGSASFVEGKILEKLRENGAPSGLTIFAARISEHASSTL